MVRALGGLGLAGLEVLVIDDSSPDGTGEIADRLAVELPWVHVLHRERKEGLGPAYLAGFRRALELDADLVFEMDCDFYTTRQTCRGWFKQPRTRISCSAPATSPAAARATGASCAASSHGAARSTPRRSSSSASAT